TNQTRVRGFGGVSGRGRPREEAGHARRSRQRSPREDVMRRVAAAALVLTLALVVGSSVAAGKPAATDVTIWVGWSKSTHEFGVFQRLIDEYNRKHPSVHVKAVSDINDDKIIAAIRSGNVPDVVSSFASSNVGSYCSSGGWINLSPYLKQSHINPKI